jgi:hypothetical protein
MWTPQESRGGGLRELDNCQGPLPIGYALAIYQVFCVFKNAVVICLCANPPLIIVTDAMAPEIRGDLQ